MFKRIFNSKRQKDIRFLSYEEYRNISSNKKTTIHGPTNSWMHPQDALKVSIESSDSTQRPILSLDQFSSSSYSFNKNNKPDSYIKVEGGFSSFTASKNVPDFKKTLANGTFASSLGVFSDTKMYSALISSELKQHTINLKYFNHPKNFMSNQYSFFDNITAWIVFLSEEADENFLEAFIDRYVDKPCLFLFEKGNRSKTGQKVSRFLVDNSLLMSECPTLLSEA